MSSLRRISSSRANGALSRGPVTLEGKQRSAMNALSHGLLARTTLMRGEWAGGLEGLLTEHVDRLAPVDPVEYGYVEEMVVARWRLRRLWAIEPGPWITRPPPKPTAILWTESPRLSPSLPKSLTPISSTVTSCGCTLLINALCTT
jgi:hypothetical protein